MQNGGEIERLGFSDHTHYLSSKTDQLGEGEQPLAEVTVEINKELILPGWLIFNRMTGMMFTVHPYGSNRMVLPVHPEAGLDMLSVLYSQSVH